MNSLLKITTTALSFAFCIGLSSCEKDALLTPTAPNPKSADIASVNALQTITRTQNAPYQVLFNYKYKYALNADGYVTERERWNQTTNQKIETDQYQYQVESVTTKL